MGRNKKAFKNKIKDLRDDMRAARDTGWNFLFYESSSTKDKLLNDMNALLTGPEDIDDKDAMLDWISKYKGIFALLDSEEVRDKIIEDKGEPDKVYDEMVKKTADIRALINDWLDVYEKNGDLLLDENGSEIEAESSKAKLAKAKLDTVKSEFKAYKAAQKEGEEFESIKDQIESDEAELKKFGKLLHDARTFRNSDEYDGIESLVNSFGKGADIAALKDKNVQKDLEGMSVRDKHALKLFLIKDQLDAYLTHKAKDGVKPNVLKKLAAVEQLNKFIGERIKELDPNDIVFKGKTYRAADVSITYQDEYKAKKDEGKNVVDYSKDESIEKIVEVARNSRFPITDDLTNAGACMDRIMLKAQENEKAVGNLTALQAAKKSFFVEQLAPRSKDIQTLASEAKEKANNSMLPDKKTIEVLDDFNVKALSSDPKTKRQELRAFYFAQTIAKNEKLPNFMKRTGKIETEELIKKAEVFANDEAYFREENSILINGNQFKRSITNIKDLCGQYFMKNLDKMEKLVANDMSDKKLIQNWDKINPMLDCFKGVLGKSDDRRVQDIISKYDKMENRMNDLAAGRVKEHEQDAPEFQQPGVKGI